MENFALDWLTITESDISAVPNPGGTGGAAPAFITNFDVSSVLEPDGVTLGTNNQMTRTSSGLDLNAVADGTVGWDRMYRTFSTPTFGNGIGDFNIEWEYAYWDGMARGTGYQVLCLSNSTAGVNYDGAGKAVTPVPIRPAATATQDSGWDILVDDSGGLWFGTDGTTDVQTLAGTTPFDLVGAGLPARVDGTFYFCQLAWNDTAKSLIYTEYTDATRATIVASAPLTASIINTSTFTTVLCCINENQIKTAFSGRDQSSQIRNLNLNLINGVTATSSILGSKPIVSVAATVESPVTRYFCASIRMADGTAAPNNLVVHLLDAAGLRILSFPNGALTTNHPAGHPTYPTTEPGWVCFTYTDLVAKQIDRHIVLLPQVATTQESGVSILVTPQLTNNGNG